MDAPWSRMWIVSLATSLDELLTLKMASGLQQRWAHRDTETSIADVHFIFDCVVAKHGAFAQTFCLVSQEKLTLHVASKEFVILITPLVTLMLETHKCRWGGEKTTGGGFNSQGGGKPVIELTASLCQSVMGHPLLSTCCYPPCSW